jgi:hypothetical protein
VFLWIGCGEMRGNRGQRTAPNRMTQLMQPFRDFLPGL